MTVQHDLLISVDFTIWAINCRVEGPTLHCGALYVGPQIPFDLIRFAYEGATVDIELPEELRNLRSPVRLWDAELPLHTK